MRPRDGNRTPPRRRIEQLHSPIQAASALALLGEGNSLIDQNLHDDSAASIAVCWRTICSYSCFFFSGKKDWWIKATDAPRASTWVARLLSAALGGRPQYWPKSSQFRRVKFLFLPPIVRAVL